MYGGYELLKKLSKHVHGKLSINFCQFFQKRKSFFEKLKKKLKKRIKLMKLSEKSFLYSFCNNFLQMLLLTKLLSNFL